MSIWEKAGEVLDKGGKGAAMAIVALSGAYLLLQGTSDRYTGTEAKEQERRLKQEINAAKTAGESADRNMRAALERLEAAQERDRAAWERQVQSEQSARSQLIVRINAIERGQNAASVVMNSMSKDLSHLVKRSEEDRKAQQVFRDTMRNLAERLVKVEAWRDGPRKKQNGN